MTWRHLALHASLVLGVACAATGGGQELEGATGAGHDPVLAELGAPLYQRHCAACHGSGGRGDGPAAAALRVAPSDLTRIAAHRGGVFPTSRVAQTIDGRFEVPSHGTREMPVWGQRFGADVPDPGVGESIARGNIVTLVEYLKSLQRPPLAPGKAQGAP